MITTRHFLAGCSFTDPRWQQTVPWSVIYARQQPSFISAESGMGIKGICTEALYWMEWVKCSIDTVIIILPTLWRYDIEADQETYLCNAMVDLLWCDQHGYQIFNAAQRKWIISGGLHYAKNTEMTPAFDFLYRHQGFLVIAKEHFRALEKLIAYCNCHKIKCVISAIQDPLDQLVGLDYIRDDIVALLDRVGYRDWLRFNDVFIDKFLGHPNHPNDREQEILCRHITNFLAKENHEQTI
jgi:hypothetical protein